MRGALDDESGEHARRSPIMVSGQEDQRRTCARADHERRARASWRRSSRALSGCPISLAERGSRHSWAKMSYVLPARRHRGRRASAGNRNRPWANSIRPSRMSMASSRALRSWSRWRRRKRRRRCCSGVSCARRPSPNSAGPWRCRSPRSSLGHVLQAVSVGIGAGELRGDLGAVHRGRQDAQVKHEHGDVEAAEVEDLQRRRDLREGL